MSSADTDDATRTDLLEAVAWWRARLPDARLLLARAATNALLGSRDGLALVELACVHSTDSAWTIDALIDRVTEEQDLGVEQDSDLMPLAIRRFCRRVLAGESTERALSRWVHSTFLHATPEQPLRQLALLDDEYDDAATMGSDLAEIRREIRIMAEQILTADPGPNP